MTATKLPPDAPAAELAPLLIPDTAASRLAGVSRATWQRLHAGGKVPAPVRLGRCVRWSRVEVEGWIAAGCPDRRMWQAIRSQRVRLAVS